MYICRHCGYVSPNDDISYCNNRNCPFYGHNTSSGIAATNERGSNEPQIKFFRPDEMSKLFGGIFRHSEGLMNSDVNDDRINTGNHNDHIADININSNHNTWLSSFEQNARCDVPNSMHSYGFATVPMQQFDKIYSPQKAMEKGTIFPLLDMPYDKKIINRG